MYPALTSSRPSPTPRACSYRGCFAHRTATASWFVCRSLCVPALTWQLVSFQGCKLQSLEIVATYLHSKRYSCANISSHQLYIASRIPLTCPPPRTPLYSFPRPYSPEPIPRNCSPAYVPAHITPHPFNRICSPACMFPPLA